MKSSSQYSREKTKSTFWRLGNCYQAILKRLYEDRVTADFSINICLGFVHPPLLLKFLKTYLLNCFGYSRVNINFI